jgi:hypothetical protein
LIISPFIFSSFSQYEKFTFRNTHQSVIIPPVINVKADSDYEYGRKSGLSFFYRYNLVTNLIWRAIQRDEDFEILSRIENQKTVLKRYYPDFFEELKGVADSTHIKLEKLIAAQLFISSYFGGECTVTASTSPATINNETFLTQNWDLPITVLQFLLFRFIFNKYFLIHDVSDQGFKYVYLGIPVLYEHPLLNEKGLGWGGTGTRLTKNESRQIDEGDGVSPYLLVRQTMMECENVSRVADFWINKKRNAHKSEFIPQDWDYDSYVWCDRDGGILMIEQTHNYIITVFGNSTEITNASPGILWHTNHHIWLDPYLTGSIIPGEDLLSEASGFRADRALELLELYWGNITLDVCMRIISDHEGGLDLHGQDAYDICRHPDMSTDPSLSRATSFAWIVQPKKYTVYLTWTQPCRSAWHEWNFSSLFERL